MGSGSGLPLGERAGERHGQLGAVVGDEPVGLEAELLEGPLLELLDAHLLLGAGHLVAVDGVDQLVVLAGQVAQRGADGEQLLLAARAGLLDLGARRGGAVDRPVESREHHPAGGQDRLGGATLADQALTPLGGLGAGLPLGGGAAVELVGATVQGAGALLGGTQREARLHLRLPRGPGGLDELLAAGGVGLLVGGVLGRG